MNQVELALDFLQNSDINRDVVQVLRQAVLEISQNCRSTPSGCPPSAFAKVDEHSLLVTTRKFKPTSSKRQQLTALEAAEIYKMRPKAVVKGNKPRRGSMIRCKGIAPKYGVSVKTIRGIWRGRTVRACVPVCLGAWLYMCVCVCV